MRVLVADDDALFRRLLTDLLNRWRDYEPVLARNGDEAWEILDAPTPPPIALLDWMMPGLKGVEVCRRLREKEQQNQVRTPVYVILLTARNAPEEVAAGLDSGADDYMPKPYEPAELRARLNVGRRFIALQRQLDQHIRELEAANAHIHTLQGIIPICMYCKKVRNDKDYWEQVEKYVSERTDALFSHAVCPECYEKYMKPQLDALDSEADMEIGESPRPEESGRR